MSTSVCTECRREVPGWEGVQQSDGKGGDLGFVCGRCWAQILSEKSNADIPHLEMEPVVLQDASGRSHEFHFRYNHLPHGRSRLASR